MQDDSGDIATPEPLPGSQGQTEQAQTQPPEDKATGPEGVGGAQEKHGSKLEEAKDKIGPKVQEAREKIAPKLEEAGEKLKPKVDKARGMIKRGLSQVRARLSGKQ